jgi:ribonuclease Y
MDSTILSIIIGFIALVVGVIVGKFLFAKNTRKQVEEARGQAQKIIADSQVSSENLKKEKILEAKEKYVQLKTEHDKEVLEKNRRLAEGETRVKQKEQSINQKL